MTETAPHDDDPMAGRLPPDRSPEKAADQRLWAKDPSAIQGGPSRTHTMLDANGMPLDFTFSYNQAREMDYAMGLRFLAAGFYVFEDEACARPLDPSRSAKEGHDGQTIPTLRDDEVIATLDELTHEALLRRAVTLRGGEGFTRQAKKEDLIAFIDAHNQRAAAARSRPEADDMIEGDGGMVGLTPEEQARAAAMAGRAA